jgi:general secretion pathway protein B
MSYILEALKKSEQERGHGSVPGVQTIHSSSLNYHHDKKSIWPLLLIALVFVNITVLVYFVLTKEQPLTVAVSQKQTSNDIVIEPAQTLSNLNTPQEETARTVAPKNVEQITAPPQTASYPDDEIVNPSTQTIAQIKQSVETVDLHDIPLNIRQHIPAMEFSAHVYSTNASQRSLVINGHFMEEGDSVANDLILSEITSDGAIFNFQGYRFSTSVLSGWKVN